MAEEVTQPTQEETEAQPKPTKQVKATKATATAKRQNAGSSKGTKLPNGLVIYKH